MEYTSLVAFMVAAILLNISPGPSLLFVSARGVSEGKAAGAVSALGLATGSSIHAVLAGLGITAVVASNKSIATVVAITGGLYILYLGYDSIKSAREQFSSKLDTNGKKNSLKKLYLQAISVEFLNPKTILFYLSILPGLIISAGYSPLEALFVSLIVPATALPIDMTAGLTGGMLAKMSEKNGKITVALNYLSGLALLSIGAGLIYSNIR
ncbi:LysE family translocator [Vibrio parahaemolyticus]|uniref:LysE family translocator n=1 Tax=Vibrio parahaemolyticus TaxID=670 RepID=UPI000414A8F1|nr:LysE family translocator [Vibrio parahaemolyticus]EHH1283071.1 LysE family translocator [Vibrio parahaemolyticus]EHK9070754.1 LysE family translocator [Vibrio parahaemolyticus]EIY6181893.1 LysE family translocator [Vibrio parahaemolyticus]EKM6951045.1 LysE family translocator [Vibrio parahaemolyticus]ELA9350725.1 LysE family translocator [Vibrio parahaemolyticus]